MCQFRCTKCTKPVPRNHRVSGKMLAASQMLMIPFIMAFIEQEKSRILFNCHFLRDLQRDTIMSLQTDGVGGVSQPGFFFFSSQ